MPTTTHLPQCFVKIGGQDMAEDFMDSIVEVVVDSSLYLPSMFTILIHDSQLKWVDDASLDIGKAVEIKFKQSDDDGAAEGVVIQGEITAIEPSFSAEGQTKLLIRGYDKAHRLHRGKKTRTFLKKKDSDLVSTIAGEAGLSADADTTSTTYDYIIQNNQTNMEFLQSRAERIGFQVYVLDGKLCFKKGQANAGDGPTLELGESLRSFRPCWTAAHQVNKVVVNSWDPKNKKQLTSNAVPSSSLNQGGMSKTGGATADGAFGTAEEVITDRPVATVGEAQELATGLSDDIGREYIEAEGECEGHPGIKAGYKITINNLGTRFSGGYLVTSATHVYTETGYKTTFSVNGRQPNTLSHLLGGGWQSGQGMGLVNGVVTGMVTNLNDPDNLGRVKVKYAWLGEIESDWMRIATPMAGAQRGIYYLPEINDEVLIAFEHGDTHRPYIIGYLWSSVDKPPKQNSEVSSGGKVNERIIHSRSGHWIILDDTDGSEKIIVRDKTGKNEWIIDSAQNSMTIKVEGDFTVEAGGKVTIKSKADMTLESQAKCDLKITGDLTMDTKGQGAFKSIGNLTLDTKAQGSIKSATQLSMEGTAQASLKGAQLSVSGDAMAEVKSSGILVVQGSLVKIN